MVSFFSFATLSPEKSGSKTAIPRKILKTFNIFIILFSIFSRIQFMYVLFDVKSPRNLIILLI